VTRRVLLVAACGLGLAAPPLLAQTYEVSFWTVDGGGTAGTSAGAFLVSGTAGQPDAGAIAIGTPYATTGGLWSIDFLPTSVASVDLSVTKTDGQTTAVPGLPLTYTIVVTNAGPAAASGASVVDVVPPELRAPSWTCAASPGSSCPAVGTGSINASVHLLVGGTATFSLTGTVDPAAVGTLFNRAQAVAPAGTVDPVAANNSAADIDVLAPQADLSLAKTDGEDPVPAGALLTYTLTLANAGPSNSAGMTVVDTLPAGVSFVGSSPGAPACTHASGVVTCALGALPLSQQATVAVQVAVHPQTQGTVTNTAVVTGDQTDPVGANDSDSEDTTVVQRSQAELAHGSRIAGDLRGVGAAADRDDYRLFQETYASYEVVLDEASGDIGAGQGAVLERIGLDGTTVVQSAAPAGSGPARTLRWVNTITRPVTDERIRVRSASCGSDCGSDDVYRLRAYETTATIPRFNNSASQVTVVILQNREAQPVAGTIAFWSAAGGLLLEQPFALAAHGSVAVNTAGLAALAGASGSITVAHDGPYGGLAGKAVALEPGTGFSFDSPLLAKPR